MTREEWLNAATAKMAPWLEAAGAPTLDPLPLCSVGWPRGGKAGTIGQCWDRTASGDRARAHVFISPRLIEKGGAQGILATLLHELIHAAVGTDCGHRGPFRKVALAVGLLGPMTATTAGPELLGRLADLERDLPELDHPGIAVASAVKKQKTRMLRATCTCGYAFRIARSWAERGLPECPLCSGEIALEGAQ